MSRFGTIAGKEAFTMSATTNSTTAGVLCMVFGLGGALMVLFVGIAEPSTRRNEPATALAPWTDESALKELARRVKKPRYAGELDALAAHYTCERRHGRSVSRAFNSTAALIRD